MRHATLVPALLALLLLPGAAVATNPWQLTCPAMPAEQPTPDALRASVRAFFPWVPAAKSLRARPIYLIALSSHTAVSRDGDELASNGYYLHRALVAIAPRFTNTLTIRGQRLGKRGTRTRLGFSITGATRCTVHSPDVSCATRALRFANALHVPAKHGWRIVRTELEIGRTGCFRLSASAANLHETIPLAVPGPDYGTSGW